MSAGTNTTHPPILAVPPAPRSRPVPPLRRPPKDSPIASAMKGKRPR
jgi:hypothetical protein